MTSKNTFMVYDVIIVVMSIVMIFNTMKVARDFFNQQYNEQLITINTVLYIVILLVSLFGLHPRTYLNLIKSIYQVVKTSLVGAYDTNDIVVYSAIANIVIITIIAIILKTMSLTQHIYTVLGVLTVGLVITRSIWSMNLCATRYNTPYDTRVTQSTAVQTTLDKVGNSDTTLIYRILKIILSIDLDSKTSAVTTSAAAVKKSKPIFNSFKKKLFNAN